jgi:hypothetical protein
MRDWELLLQGDAQVLLDANEFHGLIASGDWRLFMALYIGVVIALLALATRTPLGDRLGLKVLLIVAFGWPLMIPVIVWRVWTNR